MALLPQAWRDTARAMSEENVKIVRDAFAAFERGDVTELLDLMTDDLVTHRIDPDDAMYYGKEGFFEAMAEWVEDFDDWTLTPEEFFDASGGVVVRVRQTARGRTSGVPVESLMWLDLQIVRGRVARLTFHTDPAKALEAAGLSE